MTAIRGAIIVLLTSGLFATPSLAEPIHDAARDGDLQAIERLATGKTSLEMRDDAALTPLVLAALEGHEDVVALLIAKGADPKGRDGNGFTALHAAAHAGHVDVVKLLLTYDSALNDQENMAHITPLHAAAERGLVAVASQLIDHGAAIDLKTKHGHTPLFMATLNTHGEMVKMLRQRGADCGQIRSKRYRRVCTNLGS